jgi:uncharacterized protein (DUF58 family)
VTAPPRIAGTATEVLIRGLELQVSRRLDGLLHGDYRGLVPGHGSEPGDARPYLPGDDVRRIDWNVSARMPSVHVRETIADRELESWVLLDRSPSLDFGTAACQKRDLAFAAASAFGFLTLRTGNRFGAVTADGLGPTVLAPGTGRPHLLSVLRRLARPGPGDGVGPTPLGEAIDRLGRLCRRRGLAVVISDFIAGGDWERPLRALAARHDALAVEIVDPRELELPDVGVLDLVDPATGRRREVQTADAGLRARYAAAAAEQRAGIARAIRGSGADHLVLRTDGDWVFDLLGFVTLRRERIHARPGAGARGRP